jgi:antitoxin component YwqK of YwqJK toxin-antitoxin module
MFGTQNEMIGCWLTRFKLCLFLIVLSACATQKVGCFGQSLDGKRIGRWRCFEGQPARLKSDIGYDDRGLKSGLALQHFADGSLDTESHWLDGFLNGPLKSYRASGHSLEVESIYLNGRLHGPYRVYDEKGQIVESGVYEHGIPKFVEKSSAP